MEIPPDLVEACRRGDVKAFEALVRATERQVYTVVYRIVGNHDDAADVAQEVYLKVWKAIRQFRGDAAVTSWLYRVATNAAIASLRKRGRLADPVEPDRLAEIEAPAVTPAVDTGDVEQALTRLPAAYRTVLVMRETYGMSIEEIAKQMGSSTGAAKVRLHRARLRLADELERAGVVVPLQRRGKKTS
ncbi:MAG TPA: sigma-70 family RNA polymerase sigma factor [Actinomycetota bacterium]|nr:sigma-70 family RNA polymerase sigma factor [Actinomycetota bacterium]